jgi:arylsulfatase A-like enzyme
MRCVVLLLCLLGTISAASSQPNIVIILADDLGYTDLGCFGSRYYETPNIDRLAEQGLRLTNHHHCQNCTPSRASLLSGQYGARTGVYTVGDISRFDWQSRPLRPVNNVMNLPLEVDTFANQLATAGYATAMFGKWHLGSSEPYRPSQRGFAEAIESKGKHFDFATYPKVDYPQGQYLADFLTDHALSFMERQQGKPFLLYLPHFGVHSPFEAKPELIAKFANKPSAGGHNSPIYAAMIASVDESVGRVLAKLDELKIAENTVVIFLSDNGGVGGYSASGGLFIEPDAEQMKAWEKVDGDEEEGITDNAPLRSGKGSLYEGGIRVPFIVRWPDKIPSGATVDVATVHVDLYPTLLELASAPKPRQVLDGESLLPLFRDPAARLKREAIFQHFPGYLGQGHGRWRATPASLIHSGDWKLLEFLEDGRLELYNLREDLSEKNNLADVLPDKAKELHARLVAWRADVKAPMPTPNTPSVKDP